VWTIEREEFRDCRTALYEHPTRQRVIDIDEEHKNQRSLQFPRKERADEHPKQTIADASKEERTEGHERSTDRNSQPEHRERDTLTEKSDYAKSTVSTAMSDLKGMHIVHRRSMPGEGKKAYFEAKTDFWYIMQELLNREVMREIQIMNRALDSAAEDGQGCARPRKDS
jgi:DNA-binding transcriptional ArsR family regulator